MKKGSARKIAFILSALLLVVGISPLAYLSIFSATHNFEPLRMPLPLTPGEHPSAYFKTDQNIDYLVQINWDGRIQRPGQNFDIGWRVVDEHDTTLAQGSLTQPMLGNAANLGSFRGKRGRTQRILLTPQSDQTWFAAANPFLTISDPEAGLDMGYAYYSALIWAAISGGAILLIWLVMLCRLWLRRKQIASAAS